MTIDGYKAAIKALGLSPYRPSNGHSTLHQTRDGDFQQVPDPEDLAPEERQGFIDLIRARLGLGQH